MEVEPYELPTEPLTPRARSSRPSTAYLGKRKARRHARSILSDLPELPVLKEDEVVHFEARNTFPVPPIKDFPAKARLRPRNKPTNDPRSSHNGRFSMSLGGLQRQLRLIVKSGDSRAYRCIVLIERELTEWLTYGAGRDINVFLLNRSAAPRIIDDTPIEAGAPAITEIQRQPHQLVWFVPEPFTRKVVHLIARLWDVVSFSKDNGTGQRLTYLYRPPDAQATKGGDAFLATPPTTEFETSSFSGSTDSEWDELDIGDDTLTPEEQARLDSLATLQRVVSIAESSSAMSDYADSEGTDDLSDSIQSLSMLSHTD